MASPNLLRRSSPDLIITMISLYNDKLMWIPQNLTKKIMDSINLTHHT